MIRILPYNDQRRDDVFQRATPTENVTETVQAILQDVRQRGDAAIREYETTFDGVTLNALTVSSSEIDAAFSAVAPEFLDILREAAENIRRFHQKQRKNSFILSEENGIILGQKVLPMEKVGLYVPGGTAAYPSTVLMDSIPAKIAGCPELIMVTPPRADGSIPPVILAAAKIAGVDRIFKVGGAQAIAALAYGTHTIPRVDKIVGPGNAYVAEAKRQVFGQVAIDMIAGPSEILIIADRTSNPAHLAADLLSQAEHDPMASAVLLTDSDALAQAVAQEIENQLPQLPRQDIARASIENNGKIIITQDLAQAIALSNALAPEHLELCVDNPFDYLSRVTHAGSIFMGKYCPEALGDYFAGPNHTLPTGGTARFSNPLSVDDFVKKSQFSYYSREALAQVYQKIATFAGEEGLDGHGRSMTIRFEGEQNE